MKTVIINKWFEDATSVRIVRRSIEINTYENVTRSSLRRLIKVIGNKPSWTMVTKFSISLFYEAL